MQKVIAYITHGEDLLVFEEPDFPEAGTQVPGGTLESQELPAAGVMREAAEETGLRDLRLVRSLGAVQSVAPSGQQVQRHFFQLATDDRARQTWDHWESNPSTGGPPIRFRFRWVHLRGVPPLAGKLDCGVDFELGPIVWSRRHIFEYAGVTWDVAERFFIGRSRTSEIQPRRPDDYITGSRWWTLEQLQGSAEEFAPRSLPRQIVAILEGRYPEALIDVGV